MATITKDKDVVIKDYFESFINWIKTIFHREPAPKQVENKPNYYHSEEYEKQKIREMGRKRKQEIEYQVRKSV